MMPESQRGAEIVLTRRAVVHEAACCRAPRVLHKAASSKYLGAITSIVYKRVVIFSNVCQLMLDVDGKRCWLNASSCVATRTAAPSGLQGHKSSCRRHLPNTAIWPRYFG